jgi:molybdate transport system permease protein
MTSGVSPSQAIWLSVQVGAWCAVFGLPVAIVLGWILARYEFRGKILLNMLIFAPLVIPPVITGYLLLEIFGRSAIIGHWFEQMGLPFSFSLAGAVLASFVVGMPFYVMVTRAAFESVDPRLEEMAWTLGATPWRTFRRVTLPLALPGIAAGAVLAFARALGEFGATVVLAGNIEGKTRTIALGVYTLLESPSGMDASRVLVAASLLISLAALFGYEVLLRWHRRRLEWRHER